MTQNVAPIKWHGGKHYLASRIIDCMPDHTHYVEPFFGGGSVLFRKESKLVDGYSEVVNDLYGELANFWRVLQSEAHFAEFQRMVTLTPFSKLAWQEAAEQKNEQGVKGAVAFFIKYRQSRQGLGKDFATMSRSRTRRGMNEQVSSWLSAIEGLDEAHQRLQRVVIFSEDAQNIILREDHPQTFFYCDPPYLQETRNAKKAYAHEMTDEDHSGLLETLGGIRGKFLLSGYPHEMYTEAANRYGWQRIDIKIDNKASSQKVKPRKIECIWKNY